jgi:hypothetical protein
MPYTVDDPPTYAKNLPKGAISLCVAAFNSNYAKTKSDEKARVACWSNVKRKYKQVGGKWVRKESGVDNPYISSDTLKGLEAELIAWDEAADEDYARAFADVVGAGDTETPRGQANFVSWNEFFNIKGTDEAVYCDETPWGQINKSKLPKSSFAYAPTDKKSDWKLPYKTKDGKIHCGGVRAALQAIGGARTGKPMNVPSSVKATIRRAAKSCGIGQDEVMTMEQEQLTETLFSPLELIEQDERGYHHAKLLCTRGDYVNGNGRVYPMEVWEREVPKAKELITQGRFIGLADHPSPSIFGAGASILNTVIKFEDLWIEGHEVWGKVIIIPTSKGLDVIEIAKAGVQVGASTRGRGSTTTLDDAYTDPDGVEHQDVSMVDVDSYAFEAVDLVLRPSVGDAGMYRFEQLNDEDIEQLQGVLFAEIEERIAEPLNAKIQELEELLNAAEEEARVMEEDREEAGDLMDDLVDGLAAQKRTIEEQEGKIEELLDTVSAAVEVNEQLNAEIEELQGQLGESDILLEASKDRSKALEHTIERVRGERFSALLIEELKGCATADEVDASFDKAVVAVMNMVAGDPTPSGHTIAFPQITDLDSDAEERMQAKFLESLTAGGELSEEDKEEAMRVRSILVAAGLSL